MYTKKLTRLLIWGGASFLIGAALFCSMEGPNTKVCGLILFGWLFAGIPYGWILSAKVFPTVISLNIPVMIILFSIRLMIAAITGWIAMPVTMIRCIIHMSQERKIEKGV